MDGPPQRRRFVFAVGKVEEAKIGCGGGNLACREAFLAEQCGPMKGRLRKDAKQCWIRTCIDQRNPNIIGSEARGADERGVAFAIALKIEVCAGVDERMNKRKFFPLFKLSMEEYVTDVVEGMSADLGPIAPRDERIGTGGVLSEQVLEGFGISGFDCSLCVHRWGG